VSRGGWALGEREGAGPDNDPLLREQRAAGRDDLIRALLRQRDVPVPPDFPESLARRDRDALRAASAESVLAAASAADSLADFLAGLDDPGS
jgi:hypothetical protein